MLPQWKALMVKTPSILILATITTAWPATAQTRAEVDAAHSPGFARCMENTDAAQGVTAGIMACNGAENLYQDARLNRTYRNAMAHRDARGKIALRAAQRDWIKRRDATCHQAAYEAGGGSASGIVYSSCFLDETIRRTIWLKNRR